MFDVRCESQARRYKRMMRMSYASFANCQNCGNACWGCVGHCDAMPRITLMNRGTPMEKASVRIPASCLGPDTKGGSFNGFSSRPTMPIAVKMRLPKSRLKEGAALVRRRKVSGDDPPAEAVQHDLRRLR